MRTKLPKRKGRYAYDSKFLGFFLYHASTLFIYISSSSGNIIKISYFKLHSWHGHPYIYVVLPHLQTQREPSTGTITVPIVPSLDPSLIFNLPGFTLPYFTFISPYRLPCYFYPADIEKQQHDESRV